MKIRIQQINVTVGDLQGNTDAILGALKEAENSGVDLLVLPELVVCGYPPMDLLERNSFLKAVYEQTDRIIVATRNTGLLFGSIRPNPASSGRPIFNTAILAHQGEVVDEICKSLLPTYDVFDEFRYFEPNKNIHVTRWAGRTWGITICEDIWNNQNEYNYHMYDVDPALLLKEKGAGILINISASPFTGSKPEKRENMLKRQAKRLEMPVIYSNQVGANTELIFDGSGSVVTPDGEVKVRLATLEEDYGDFVWNEDGSIRAVHSHEDSRTHEDSRRPANVTFRDAIRPSDKIQISDDARTQNTIRTKESDFIQESEHSQDDSQSTTSVKPFPGKEERLYCALVLGLRDYVEKSGMPKRVVLGLSGGIDSALTAVIAKEALGSQNVMGVTMPSSYSSKESVTDSEKLAHKLGITLHKMAINEIYGVFLKTLKPLFGDSDFGIAEENLQSRARGTILMAISNKFGHLLLNTGNKSELAVGYCTLYGDMAGGVSVLSDLYKTEVYAVSRWLNESFYKEEVIPVSSIEKPPSAELRPDQKDTDSLPEYDILDGILKAYIEDQLPVERIADLGFSREQVLNVIRMVDRNEYKRRQAAPGLRITSKAFGSGRRLPIVQRWSEN